MRCLVRSATALPLLWTTLAAQGGGACLGPFSDDFADGFLDPAVWDVGVTDGTVDEVGGELVFIGSPSLNSGTSVRTKGALCGDFDVSVAWELVQFAVPVDCARFAGIQVRRASDLSFVATIERFNEWAGGVGACVPSTTNYKAYGTSSLNCDATFTPTSDMQGSFRLQRVGSSLTMSYAAGGAWVPLLAVEGSTDDVVLGLFASSCTTGGHEVHFDDLAVVAESLSAHPEQISLASGGAQAFELHAGSAFANQAYLLLGSASGTAPPLTVDGVDVPLVADGYFLHLLSKPNTLISPSLAALDGGGGAMASLHVPAGLDPALAGLTLHHAYVVLGAGLQVEFASNATSLVLVP